MCPRVDQRVVVQEREVVMRILPLILREKGCGEVRADVRPQVEGLAREVLCHGLLVQVQDGEGPEDVVEDVLRTKYLEALCVEFLVLAQPVDLPQVELD